MKHSTAADSRPTEAFIHGEHPLMRLFVGFVVNSKIKGFRFALGDWLATLATEHLVNLAKYNQANNKHPAGYGTRLLRGIGMLSFFHETGGKREPLDLYSRAASIVSTLAEVETLRRKGWITVSGPIRLEDVLSSGLTCTPTPLGGELLRGSPPGSVARSVWEAMAE